MIKYKIFHLLPEFGTNTYLVWDEVSKEAILIDPANVSEELLSFIHKKSLVCKYILNTHGHADHIAGNSFFKEHLNVPLLIHEEDSAMLQNAKQNLSSYIGNDLISPKADLLLHDGDELSLGNELGKIIHTPGHTIGGICIQFSQYLFSGDTLFAESIGRTDFPNGSLKELKKSIQQKLFTLPDETIVLPGHGESTTIEKEKIENPFVGIVSKL